MVKYVFVLAALLCVRGVYATPQDEKQESTEYEAYNGAELLITDSPKRYLISGINVHGVEMYDESLLLSSVGLNVGDSITLPSAFVSTMIDRLWSQGRFSDVEFAADIVGEDVVLDLFLKEQPRVLNWDVTGIPKGQKRELLESLKFRRNSELSDYVVDKNIGVIKKYLTEKGFRNTEVEVLIANDTILNNMINVTFDVDRKEKVKIKEITFIDNEQFTDKKLRSTFKKTHQRSLNFLQSRKFNETEFAADKVELIDFYNSKGYRNATVVKDSIYIIDEKSMGIAITVAEGNKYYLRDITWVGNSIYETEMLEQMFGFKSGDTYDKKSMYKRLGVGSESNPEEMSVSSLYQNNGYLMSQIEPAETIVGRDSIDLQLKIYEGKPFTINNVPITGNMRVDDEVIRREIYTRPGELYNRALLMQTMRMLSTMGHFDPEVIAPNIQPVSNSLVDVGWALEEQASDQLSISGGWGGGTFVGSVAVTLNNLSIGDALDGGKWAPYPMGQNQRFTIQAQSNGSYYKSLSMSFSDPWMGGKKPNSFTTAIFYSDQNNAYYAWEESTQYFRTLGVSAGLGKRLTWPDPAFSIYGEVAYQRYMLKDWSYFVMDSGNSNLLSMRFVFARNSVDQQIYPRSGSDFSVSVQATPPYSLFDGKDYSDDTMSDEERYKWIEFHKWELKTQWYQSFLRNSNLVLMLKAEMGYLGNYDPNKISPFERFEVGGDGISGYDVWGVDMISLRGYTDGSLDPVDSDYSIAYNKYTVELRYPIILKPSSQIYVLGFLEGGNGFKSWRDYSPFDVRRSAGLGVRLYLPIVGMLGMDWGYGFDPVAGGTTKSGSQFHFVMGQQF